MEPGSNQLWRVLCWRQLDLVFDINREQPEIMENVLAVVAVATKMEIQLNFRGQP